jgi:ubiquinone/menaquinone biosynthesis C-methylase UbiE
LSSTRDLEIRNFRAVDATHQAEQFIAFVDGIERLAHAVEVRERSYQLLAGQPEDAVVDVGCGTGRAVAEMSDRGLRAVGVDISQQMISVARRRFPEGDFRVAAAASLPFADGSLNLYRSERVYQYLAHPEEALLEARRVLSPDGRIVLMDPDGDMWAIAADDHRKTRAMILALSDSIANRWIGRRYHTLLLDAGFVDVAIEVRTGVYTDYTQMAPMLPGMMSVGVAAGVLTQEELDDWLAEQKQRGQAGRFFMAMPVFIASARQP